MRVTLIAFTLAALLLQNSPPDRRQQQEPSKNKQQSATQTPAQSFVTAPENQTGSDQQKSGTEKKPQQGPQKPAWWDATWANWGLLIVGLAGTIAALWTLSIIRGQSNHIRKTADAALLNAEAVISAERAWVFSKMEKLGREHFILKVSNNGKTPAEIIDIKQQETWTDLTDIEKRELPIPPNYGLDTRFVQPRIIVPGGSFIYDTTVLGQVLPEDVLEEFRRSKKRYFIYGRIQYKDLIDRAKVRETGFCYFWSPLLDEFLIGGPSEYTYYT